MKIHIASDHAGYKLKEKLKVWLNDNGHKVIDCGADSYNEYDDYPDFVVPCAQKVADDKKSVGLVIGGTGQGEMIFANKVAGIRCALFYGAIMAKSAVDISGRASFDSYEIVRLARQHNDANMLALSARFMSEESAKHAVTVFLDTKFSNEERHIRRIQKLENIH